jgi:hypothetical protein
VWVSSLGVQHLLSVAVVGGDTKDIASLLAGIVDGLHSSVGGRDGLDGSVIDTSVTNL